MKKQLTALLLGVAALQAQADPVIYSQPYDGNAGGGFASQNDTVPGGFGNFATVYDNFTFPNPHNITDVHWTGIYFNSGHTSDVTGFTIQFWSDNAGEPGVSLASYSIVGTANQTSLGSDVFSYDTILSSAFQAQAGIQYWLSVVPDLGFPPQWGWLGGTGGDGLAYQDFLGSRSSVSPDRAFQLTGTGVPEPATLGLFLVALPAFRLFGKSGS